MSDNTEINVAETLAVIESEDGPTAVFVADGKKKFRLTKKKLMGIIALIIAFIIVAEGITAVVLCSSVLSRNGSKGFYEYAYGEDGLEIAEKDKAWVEDKAESIYIENDDGKELHALEIINKNISHSYVVMCHQYGESASSMGEYAKHFYELGFNIILPDLRGHGESEYSDVSMGWLDRLDILKWVGKITENDPEARIVLFGVSLGGTAVTMAAGEELPENVRAVIADSCYSDVRKVMKTYIGDELKLPAFPILNIASRFCEIKNGWSFKTASTVQQSSKITVPILFIHGEEDTFANIGQSNEIFEVCSSENVEQKVIQDGVHGKNLKTDESTYWSAVDMFILDNLGLF